MATYSKNLNSIKWSQLKQNCSDYVVTIARQFFDALLKKQDQDKKVLQSTVDAYNKSYQLNSKYYLEYLETIPQWQFNLLFAEI